MKSQSLNFPLALLGGVTLASMISINSKLATFASPLLASWVAHGVGTVTSFFVLLLLNISVGRKTSLFPKSTVPIWAYLGGIPGAFTVILAAITVNSSLGLSASIALIMAGQVLFGLICDNWGLFGLQKRAMNRNDATALLFMVIGCLITIFGRG